jgi:hypothetical protein
MSGTVALLTPGRIADALEAPLSRVLYVLRTRPQITPCARAGTLRLYSRTALPLIRQELEAIAAKQNARGGK